jgi:YNFM family putative membrane transporter
MAGLPAQVTVYVPARIVILPVRGTKPGARAGVNADSRQKGRGHVRLSAGPFGQCAGAIQTMSSIEQPPAPAVQPVPYSATRAIVLLAMAGFASQALVRVTDSLLPQIATDLNVTIGAASIVVALYAVMHGTVQLVIGPVADRVGKFRTVIAAAAVTAISVMLCGMAQSLGALAVFRLASGATAGWIIPLGMAYIGDAIPYERRQQVLGRYLFGTISGQLFGQAAGGVLGDYFGWRNVFFFLAALFAIVSVAMLWHVIRHGRPQSALRREGAGFVAEYKAVFGGAWARTVLLAVFFEGFFAFGALTYIGADLHTRFGLSFSLVGAVVASFAIGGLFYSLGVGMLVRRLGQVGLTTTGGILFCVAYLALALQPVWWVAPFAVALIGLGFYMFHNTLQTNATQMTPQARGTAVAIFAAALYIGQTMGVFLGAVVVDNASARPVFAVAGVALLILTVWFARQLRKRQASGEASV